MHLPYDSRHQAAKELVIKALHTPGQVHGMALQLAPGPYLTSIPPSTRAYTGVCCQVSCLGAGPVEHGQQIPHHRCRHRLVRPPAHNSASIGEDGADLSPLPSRQLRLVSNAIAGVAPSLISAVTNPGAQEGDSLLKHVQALTQHIQQALAISTPFPGDINLMAVNGSRKSVRSCVLCCSTSSPPPRVSPFGGQCQERSQARDTTAASRQAVHLSAVIRQRPFWLT